MVSTMQLINAGGSWQSVNNWGMVEISQGVKLEAIQQPESFILTCEYCGTSHRVKDDFSCPACGAPFNMKKVTALPMMVHKTDFSELDADKILWQHKVTEKPGESVRESKKI